MSNAIAALDPMQLLERVANGAYLRDLAIELQIDKRRLSEQLRKYPKEYQAAKESCHEGRLDAAEQAFEAADDQTDVARARAYWTAIAWRAERECADRWGSKAIQINVGAVLNLDPSLVSRLDDVLERATIAGECAKSVPSIADDRSTD